MAQTANSQPPQTSHVEWEQTLSARFQKLPTQLNTLNRFVPKLVRVSLNASDGQQLAWCVPAFSLLEKLTLIASLLEKLTQMLGCGRS